MNPITVPADIELSLGEAVYVQNVGTEPLFVKRGSGASSTDFHYPLAGGLANDDGLGSAVVIDSVVDKFVGPVSFAGTDPRYVAWKR
jgi:hypothetical protein